MNGIDFLHAARAAGSTAGAIMITGIRSSSTGRI